MKKFVFLFAVLSLMRPLPGSAVTMISPGMDTCSTWTQGRRSHGVAELNARAWIAGYLSALNAAVSGHLNVDILKDNIDVEGLWAWIDSFCRNHPLDTIQSAANGLGDELIRRATRVAPAPNTTK
jgi:hypothetical protein